MHVKEKLRGADRSLYFSFGIRRMIKAMQQMYTMTCRLASGLRLYRRPTASQEGNNPQGKVTDRGTY